MVSIIGIYLQGNHSAAVDGLLKDKVFQWKQTGKGWDGWSSMVECLPGLGKALGSRPNTAKKKKKPENR